MEPADAASLEQIADRIDSTMHGVAPLRGDTTVQTVPNSKSSQNESRKIGPYRLEKRLGAGGMGAVYRAFDERLERPVALKQILPEALEKPQARKRLRREARSAARLSHPGIVKVYDLIEAKGCDWIVMELAEGEALDRLLRAGALPLERTLALGAEIAAALTAAHAEGIVHRDLKAKNVLVTRDGAKILDFGLAKQILYREGSSTSVSVEGQILGTPHAMSPEQAMGHKVDLRSDLFSLGNLLYEMVTGSAPFRGANPIETLTKVCTHLPPAAREVAAGTPRALSDLIDRLLEKDPAHRPQTAGEVVLALQLLADSSVEEISLDRVSVGRPAPASGRESATFDEPLTGHRTDQRRLMSEHRQVTVMCCELVGGDPSSGSLDPEVLSRVMDGFEHLAREAIERFEGHLANILGHRLVVYFGYPQAHEDDARRAVNAAHEMVARCKELRDRSQHPDLAVRIGIHTGSAVMLGGATQQEQLALGTTLDLTTGLQKLGGPNDVLISRATRRLVTGTYTDEALAPAQLVGFSEPIEVFRIRGVQDLSSQWQATGNLTPLVARERELELLIDRFEMAREGCGQAVLLSGEAGIGKSRLVHTLRERLGAGTTMWLSAQCSAYTRNSPFHPIIELLRHIFRLNPDKGPEAQLTRLEEGLSQYGLNNGNVVPLFAALLALPSEGRYPSLNLSPSKQRDKTLEVLQMLFMEIARKQTVALLVEDLHWVDPSTLELLEPLIDRATQSSLFLVLTFRLEFEPPWGHQAHLAQLNLTRLAEPEVVTLIEQVTKGRGLPTEIQDQIAAKTDGVPLFVEEFTKNVLESGLLIEREGRYELTGSIEELAVPPTLRDSLTARLDRLGAAKDVAQLAATVGREFSYQLLAAVSPLEESALRWMLDRLVEAQLVHRKGFSKRQRYLFKHALIQGAAYASMLKRQQRRHHAKIAEILVEQFPETRPELLAHHYTEARLTKSAIGYWLKAGQASLQGSAILEAIGHLDKGLELLENEPASPELNQLELTLQTTLGGAYVVSRGFQACEVERAYSRSHELCGLIGDAPELGWVLRGLWFFYSTKEVHKSLVLAQQMRQLAESKSDTELLMAAQTSLGVTHMRRGGNRDLAISRNQFEQEIALDSHNRDLPVSGLEGGDPGVVSLCHLAFVLWILGYPDQALDRINEVHTLAWQISQSPKSYHLSWAYSWEVLIHHNRRDPRAVRESAKKAITCCEQVGVPIWLAQTQILLGSALAADGNGHSPDQGGAGEDQVAEGFRLMECGFEIFRDSGAKTWVPFIMSILVNAYAEHGQAKLELLEEALATISTTEERFWAAELHRLRGRIALIVDPANITEAESQYLQALEIARNQDAKSLELRAALSLSRLWQNHRRKAEARKLLSDVYAWFSEGFETRDLQEARSFLTTQY